MSDDQVLGASLLLTVVLGAVVAAISYAIGAVLFHFLFKKIGVRPWRAWVPLVNLAAVLQAGGYSGWWVLGYLVPGLNIAVVILVYLAYYRVGKGLRLDDTLNILGIIVGFWVILALAAGKPYDHRLTGVATRQPDQLEEIAAGRLVDATAAPLGAQHGWGPGATPGRPPAVHHQPQAWGQVPQPYGQQVPQPYGQQAPQPYGQQAPQPSGQPYGQQGHQPYRQTPPQSGS